MKNIHRPRQNSGRILAIFAEIIKEEDLSLMGANLVTVTKPRNVLSFRDDLKYQQTDIPAAHQRDNVSGLPG